MKLDVRRTVTLFAFMDKRLSVCSKCGGKFICTAVRIGYYKDIIGLYKCRCAGNEKFRIIYRGLSGDEKKEFEEILGKDVLDHVRENQDGAVSAEIRCGVCGEPRKYVETEIRRSGEILHRFDCRNGFCRDFEKSIWLELTDEDVVHAKNRAQGEAKCRICGEISGAKFFCRKERGLVCEKHCLECEFRDGIETRFICRYKGR